MCGDDVLWVWTAVSRRGDKARVSCSGTCRIQGVDAVFDVKVARRQEEDGAEEEEEQLQRRRDAVHHKVLPHGGCLVVIDSEHSRMSDPRQY